MHTILTFFYNFFIINKKSFAVKDNFSNFEKILNTSLFWFMKTLDYSTMNNPFYAGVAKLADALDLGSSGETHESSTLSVRTNIQNCTVRNTVQ